MASPEDVIQVTATINLYAVALDFQRFELFEQVFTEDVRTDFGGGAEFSGRQSLVEAFKAIHAPFHSTQHIVSGHSVTVDGNTAYSMTYVHAHFTRIIDGTHCVFDSCGWYDDKLVRQADGWLIQDRVSRMVTANGDHRVMQAMPGVDVNFKLLSPQAEARAGRIQYLKHA